MTEASRLARVPVAGIRSMVRSRYVVPARGPRGALRFSFHDLVVLRTGRQLLAAGISARRVGSALRKVREQLPPGIPARGLSVTASGGRVVVHEEGARRDALSGQLLLAFEVRMEHGRVALVDMPMAKTPGDGDDVPAASEQCEVAFADALALEDTDIDAAIEAYRACVARHAHAGAMANLGRLLHLQGRISEALQLYAKADPGDPDLLYNRAVALEDLGRNDEAIAAYTQVLKLDADFADAHHNLARLLRLAGEQRLAVRHWNAYRRLSRGNEA
jgi:tetratricopeptide (TPR) repeat protein